MTIEEYLYYIILPILAISVLLVFCRFVLGPSIADRVVALDLLITIGITIIAVYSIVYYQSTFLDIAMILGLIAFLSTVAFSYYLEKRNRKKREKKKKEDNAE
ncbi:MULTISPECIES: monovalent cation/H+ antiporter complex subunit F [Mesonia]|uniref:Na(+)/H(+) antiporter subunit F1 n=1 Tax=Mesonia oceanica TaxID=2687242 RepID=A0AC61YC54_9FLAO|nr:MULTISPECIES: monovalent cation/H+ antiporter complex subunit F [Mesonia]MAN28428.1 cation:proton antiporter [Mesonia sp.]MAQ40150.1 cation:proton antiporter [Mesonia sp.]MBJ98923.1 cation:proton antiporter [Flavobacteriaceae bacterium]VVV01840.1 Na(+)/H(+) antiporter subunit F1 [Mesonia oceanica]|tara:strand:- start:39897 stop:40205 length:309 start_codon:yes stop_codon:yes gene_type:complete